MSTLTVEQKAKAAELFEKVKKIEKEYGSDDYRTIEDIEGCYTDYYTLSAWEEERYTEEKGEGFMTFEDFLLDFIEQNIMIG